jgi:geranylgeranylglycerol-phosphate geranylgeranyltransferase
LEAGSFLGIIRPVNCGMIGLAVLVGEFVSKPPGIPLLESILGFLTGFFICAYAMVVNDVYDVEVDKVNQPGRPIPSGKISVTGATRLSILLLVVGMAFAALSLSPAAVIIAASYAFLSWLYNWWAKKSGLAGNLIVASSLAIPFVYGGVISGGSVFSSLLLMMAFTSFFSGVGREVVKAIADVEGDSKRGIASLARIRGARAAGLVGAAFFMLAVVTSWLPLFLALANVIYILGVWIPDAVFVYLSLSILRNSGAENAHRVKNRALFGMLAGLVVFIGGGL